MEPTSDKTCIKSNSPFGPGPDSIAASSTNLVLDDAPKAESSSSQMPIQTPAQLAESLKSLRKKINRAARGSHKHTVHATKPKDDKGSDVVGDHHPDHELALEQRPKPKQDPWSKQDALLQHDSQHEQDQRLKQEPPENILDQMPPTILPENTSAQPHGGESALPVDPSNNDRIGQGEGGPKHGQDEAGQNHHTTETTEAGTSKRTRDKAGPEDNPSSAAADKKPKKRRKAPQLMPGQSARKPPPQKTRFQPLRDATWRNYQF
ncbi:hypothetical protein BJX76DRAFT_214697 [Aspergillus varians]